MVTREEIRLRDGNRCARCGSPRDLHVHHRVRRSHGGRDLPQNLITFCFECHHWVHHHVYEARKHGWLLRRHEDPAQVPVDHFLWPAGPVLLAEDETFTLWWAAQETASG